MDKEEKYCFLLASYQVNFLENRVLKQPNAAIFYFLIINLAHFSSTFSNYLQSSDKAFFSFH